MLADALEAVIAAVYLDGGLEASRNFTVDALTDELREIDVLQETPGGDDYKTRFQEWCQKRYDVLPRYVVVRETGPDHQKEFEVEVRVNDRVLGSAEDTARRKRNRKRRSERGNRLNVKPSLC